MGPGALEEMPSVFQSGSLGEVSGNSEVAEVQYSKTDVTSFRVMLNDIDARSGSHNGAHKSYDLLWNLPGYGILTNVAKDGVACQLNETYYVFENRSDYVLYLRLQRPMGYKEDPSAIGMWEPLSGKSSKTLLIEMKPYTKRKIKVGNTSTTYMVPRHIMREGKVYVHLMSYAVFKDPWDFHGESPTVDGVALEVGVETHFLVNNGEYGNRKGDYIVDRYDNAKRMDMIDTGPGVPIRIKDLSISTERGSNRVSALIAHKNAAYGGVRARFFLL